MVTHDVDEALFVADRVVMMTNGPRARVGGILSLPFARPRVRREVLEHPGYYELRARLITFLEEQEQAREGGAVPVRQPARVFLGTEPELS
jgi:ABC-type nitrate/sulfonate/bicarbonate transport system ATPase subunit